MKLELPYEPSVSHLDSLETGDDPDMFLRKIVDTCASSVAVLDEAGNVLYVSRVWKALAIAAGPEMELDNLSNTDLGTFRSLGKETAALAEDVQRIVEGQEQELRKEYSWAGPDGPRWYLIHAARLDLPRSNGFRVLITREDVTRHKQAEEALRSLGGRLINAQEEERSRVARELHDDLNQQLAILSIELEQLEQKMPDDRRDLSASVRSLWTRAHQISSDVHRLSYKLHPAKLDHLGLGPAIKSLCDEVSQHREISIDFQQQGFPAVLSREVTLCVFRITQESLQNVARHSGARNAQVVLRKTFQGVHLRVSDTGCGFDMRSSRTKSGLGFISMRERLRLVGGRISIRSQPLTGTQIDVIVPIDAALQTDKS
jgi:signal transduction histidine kinase